MAWFGLDGLRTIVWLALDHVHKTSDSRLVRALRAPDCEHF